MNYEKRDGEVRNRTLCVFPPIAKQYVLFEYNTTLVLYDFLKVGGGDASLLDI